MVLCDHKDDNLNNDQYDIVDGQQRTSTLLIIFHEIMNLIDNVDNSTDSKEILPNLKYKECIQREKGSAISQKWHYAFT